MDKRFWLPSDQGKQFDGDTFHNLCKMLGIDKRRTTAYYLECNGRIERMHRVLKEMLATKIPDFPNWLHLLPLCEFLINTAINKYGVSPAMLVYGEQPVLPQLFFTDALLEEPAVPLGLSFLLKVVAP